MVIYLFKSSTPTPPLKELSGGKEILTFHYQVIKLWTLDAQEYVNAHALSLYPLLPAMECADANILLQAIDELVQYYKNSQTKLQRRLLWFQTFLDRADTILPDEEKAKVRQRLDIFDQLLEESPFVRKQRMLGEEQGLTKGRVEGSLQKKEA